MSPTADYDAFEAFTLETLPDARHTARMAVGDGPSGDVVVRRAYTRIARRWKLVSAEDPRGHLLEAVEDETRQLPEVGDAGEAVSDQRLAELAWSDARAQRGGARRTRLAVLTVLALLVTGYVITWSVESALPDGGAQTGTHATELSRDMAVLSPPESLNETRQLHTSLPTSDNDFAAGARSLDESGANVFSAAFTLHDGTSGVVGGDRIPRLLDGDKVGHNARLHPRSISAAGDRVALTTDTEVTVVDTEAEVTRLPLPRGFPEPTDAAWTPEDESIMVSSEISTITLDSQDGQVTERDWYGPASVFVTEDVVTEFVSSGPNGAVQSWSDGEATGEPRAVSAPIAGWRSAPFTSDSSIVRECLPTADMEIPPHYGTAVACIAQLSSDGEVRRVLAIPDDYSSQEQPRVLGIHDDRVFFTVRTMDSVSRELLTWRPEDDELRKVSTFEQNQMFTLGVA